MRIRRKKWARPELEVCPFYIDNSEALKGSWHTVFSDAKPIYMELGCGKGTFVAEAALQQPDVNWLAMDIKSEMLAVARRTIVKRFAEENREITNLRLVRQNIERIFTSFGAEDTVDRIYINFCNPWPRGKHNKRRLTHVRQLEQYRVFLRDGGEIRFKTDDDELFNDSKEYFEECGFTIRYITYDLHNSDYTENIETEHERMFTAEGKTTKFLIAVKDKPYTPKPKEKHTEKENAD